MFRSYFFTDVTSFLTEKLNDSTHYNSTYFKTFAPPHYKGTPLLLMNMAMVKLIL